MNRFHWAFVAFGGAGVACFLAYIFLSARTEGLALLEDPFLLVPIGWLLAFIGGICLLAAFASRI